jgi:hypothetical protein
MAKTPKHLGGLPPPHGDATARTIKGTVEVEARLPQELTEEFVASNKETSARENSRLVVERITLVVLLCVALLNLFVAYQSARSANAAESAAKTASDTLKVSQRPWVFLDVQANSDVSYNEGGQMYMYTLFTLKNLGTSPAVNAQLAVELVGDNVDGAVKKACDSAEVQPGRFAAMREAYFAGVPTYKPWVLTFDPVKQGHSAEHNGTFDPFLVACAAYQSSFDPGTWHHTWKSFIVMKHDLRSPNGFSGMEAGKPVKKADVVFGPWVHPEGED